VVTVVSAAGRLPGGSSLSWPPAGGIPPASTTPRTLSVGCGWLARIAEPQRAMAIPLSVSPAVVILSCSGNPLQTQTNYTVLTVDGSPNSPPIGTGGSCATALAFLVSQGFKNAKLAHDSSLIDLLVYTMVRGSDISLN
jgi:hypothetical protein